MPSPTRGHPESALLSLSCAFCRKGLQRPLHVSRTQLLQIASICMLFIGKPYSMPACADLCSLAVALRTIFKEQGQAYHLAFFPDVHCSDQ